MTVVRNTVLDPAGDPRRFLDITITLVASTNGHLGSMYGEDQTVIGTRKIRTNGVGLWSSDFEPNEGAAPENTYYRIVEGHNAEAHEISVPATGGPFWVGELLLDPPPALGPVLSQLLADEVERATDAEADLVAGLAAEIVDREGDVDQEQARAQAVEADLVAAVAAEEARAEGVEADLSGAIDDEVDRATAQEALKLAKAANLADVADPATALANLGGIGAAGLDAVEADIAGLEVDLGNLDTEVAALAALDAQNVKLTGAQAVAGVKTFSSPPVVPDDSFAQAKVVGLVTALAARALDSAVVHNSGAEAIAGVKTFSSAPVVPAGAFPQSAVASLVSDLAARALDAAVVHNTGGETIAGVKTFSSSPVVPTGAFPQSAVASLVVDLAAKAADATVVHLAGAESVTGVKTFTAGPIVAFPGRAYGATVATEEKVFEPGVYVDLAAVFGINITAAGTRVDAARAAIFIQMEDLFRQNSGTPYGSESHWNVINPAGGSPRRPWAMFAQHSPSLSYIDLNARVGILDSTATIPYFVFDTDTGGAFRVTNGAFMEFTAAAGASTDAMIIAQRAASAAWLQDAQIMRVRADGNFGFRTWNQFGSGTGVEGHRNAGTIPSTNPTDGYVQYGEGGIAKFRGSDGQVDSVRTAQPAAHVLRSATNYGSDAGDASLGLNTIEYVAFWVEEQNTKVNRILFHVTTQAGNVDVGIMDDDGSGGAPGTRLASSGAFACPPPGPASGSFGDATLQPGRYFAVLASNNASAQFRYVTGCAKISALAPVRYVGSGATIPAIEFAPSPDTTGASVFAVTAAHT